MGKVAALNGQASVHWHHQAFNNRVQHVACARIVVIGVLTVNCVCSRPELHTGWGVNLTGWDFEALLVPRLGSVNAICQHLLGSSNQLSFRRNSFNQLQAHGLLGIKGLPQQQELQATLQIANHTHNTLRTTATWEQTDFHFRQSHF